MAFDQIAAIIGLTNGAIKTAKYMKDSSSSLDEAVQKDNIAELISSLADLKIAISDLKVQMIEK